MEQPRQESPDGAVVPIQPIEVPPSALPTLRFHYPVKRDECFATAAIECIAKADATNADGSSSTAPATVLLPTCSGCGKIFTKTNRARNLTNHNCNGRIFQAEQDHRMYCPKCKASFTEFRHLLGHMASCAVGLIGPSLSLNWKRPQPDTVGGRYGFVCQCCGAFKTVMTSLKSHVMYEHCGFTDLVALVQNHNQHLKQNVGKVVTINGPDGSTNEPLPIRGGSQTQSLGKRKGGNSHQTVDNKKQQIFPVGQPQQQQVATAYLNSGPLNGLPTMVFNAMNVMNNMISAAAAIGSGGFGGEAQPQLAANALFGGATSTPRVGTSAPFLDTNIVQQQQQQPMLLSPIGGNPQQQQTSSFLVHQSQIAGVRWRCALCKKVFHSRDAFNSHFEGQQFKCSCCGTKFKQVTQLRNHQKLERCQKTLTDEQRAADIKALTEVMAHSAKGVDPVSVCIVEPPEASSSQVMAPQQQVLPTLQPPIRKGQSNLMKIPANHSLHNGHGGGGRDYRRTCRLCGQLFAEIKAATWHLARDHYHEMMNKYSNVWQRAPRGIDRMVSCELCGRKYSKKESLRHHVLVQHARIRNTQGDEEGGLQDQIILPSASSPGASPDLKVCRHCDKSFSKRRALLYHILLSHHGGNIPSYYSKIWTEPLKVKGENGEELFACQICAKRFSKTFFLQNHVLWYHYRVLFNEQDILEGRFALPNNKALTSYLLSKQQQTANTSVTPIDETDEEIKNECGTDEVTNENSEGILATIESSNEQLFPDTGALINA